MVLITWTTKSLFATKKHFNYLRRQHSGYHSGKLHSSTKALASRLSCTNSSIWLIEFSDSLYAHKWQDPETGILKFW